MSRRAVEIVSSEIQRQAYKYRPRLKGGQIWICCPLHGERSASCRINLDHTKGRVGGYYCFGCGEKGSWNKLCNTTGMTKLSDDDLVEFEGYRRYSKKRNKLRASLGESTATTVEDVLQESFNTRTTFDVSFLGEAKWRGISAKFLTRLGARVFMDVRNDNNPVLFLPNYVHGQVVGGIKAMLEKRKGQLSYIESIGDWSMTKGLYPFDHVAKMLKRKNLKFAVLVEGPRDALTLIRKGIPALAILGTQKWSDAKRDLLLSLDLELVISYMDADRAGRIANKRMKAELSSYVNTKVLSLTALMKELELEELDPATVPDEYLQDIWDLAVQEGAY